MEFLNEPFLSKPLWMWLAFLAIVIVLLALDLGVLNRKPQEIGIRKSLYLSGFYLSLGLLFGAAIDHHLGRDAAFLYLTGFLVEKSLAMDNIFVIAMIFTYFGIPRAYQHRVLFWGILGVIVLRAIMIGLGATIVTQFEWVLYLFAVFLIFTGAKMLIAEDADYDVSKNPLLKFMRRRFRVTDELQGARFFVRREDPRTGRLHVFMTPLFLALCLVEIADVIFAVDSIPAIFAITTDPYIVYTSNIFAILGLRALFFALSALLHRFVYLKHALALVLIFIGGKIFAADLLGIDKVPPSVSLSVTIGLLAIGVVASLIKTRTQDGAARS